MSDQEIKQKKVLSIRQIEAKRKGGLAKAQKFKQKSEQTEQESEQVEQESEQDKLYRYIEYLESQIESQKKGTGSSHSIIGILIPLGLTILNESGLIPYLLSLIKDPNKKKRLSQKHHWI